MLQVSGVDSYFIFMAWIFQFAWLLLILCCFRLSGTTTLANPQAPLPDTETWQAALGLAAEKKYNEALQLMLTHPPNLASQTGQEDPVYDYNLGTLYYQIGDLGAALGYLERANHTRPNDPDIKFNLDIARAAFSSRFGSERLDPASTSIQQISDRFTQEECRELWGVLGILAVALWAIAYWKTREISKALSQLSGLLGLLSLTLLLSTYALRKWATDPAAICLHSQTIESGPGNTFVELAKLEAGTKVRLLGTAQDAQGQVWQQIRFSTSGIGWVKASSLLTL